MCVQREKQHFAMIVTHCWATNINSKLKCYFPSSITGEGEENSFFSPKCVKESNISCSATKFRTLQKFLWMSLQVYLYKNLQTGWKCAQMFSGPGIGWSETCPALFWIYNLVLCRCKSHLLLCNRFSLRTFAFSLHWWVFLSFLRMGNTIAL